MVIGRALGGRPTIKALQDYFKLYLPTSYTKVTLLTRGFFKVLFTDEEGVKSARKITTMEWIGLNLSFSKYIPNFDASVQGAETLPSHTIKVQFSNLHKQFRNTKTFTVMASKIGEVFEIELENSYIKRPTNPMITMETCDINKFAGYIPINSFRSTQELNIQARIDQAFRAEWCHLSILGDDCATIVWHFLPPLYFLNFFN
jgi:hypothetical protein